MQNQVKKAIGVFDSGYGGLTLLKEIVKQLPDYDYVYLGDNARSPYGTRSFETVYAYTLQCVKQLFAMDCELIILACNTASAKALRSIQQNDLGDIDPNKRVLGVIRPSAEVLGNYSKTNHVGILGTKGTVASNSYPIEIEKFFPALMVHQEACPMWVPLVENNEMDTVGADYFIQKKIEALLSKNDKIDCIILGCTHYPLLLDKIRKFLPAHISILCQGEIVATSLADYLKRNNTMEQKLSKDATLSFYTTDTTESFDNAASRFFGQAVQSKRIIL